MDRKGLGPVRIFGLIWTSFIGVFDGFVITKMYHQVRATRFAQTVGTVTHSEVTSHSDSDGDTYGVKIEYNYVVDAKHFSGDRYRYGASRLGVAPQTRQVSDGVTRLTPRVLPLPSAGANRRRSC